MKNKILTLAFLLAVVSITARAQDFSFTQYHNTPLFTNPAMVGTSDYYRAMINYRSQTLVSGQSYNTPVGTFTMPFYGGGRRVAGLGLSVLRDDQSRGLINTGFLAAGSYNIPTGKSLLGVGLQAGYIQSRVDLAGKTTDLQWINGVFNPNAPTGEKLSNEQTGYFTAGGGLFWYMPDERYRQKFFLGVSGFNLNEPSVKFFSADDTKVARRIVATGGVRVLKTEQFSIVPNARFVNFASKNHANIGSWFRYHLPVQPNGRATDVSVGLWYNTNKYAAFSVELENQNIVAAFSYDIPAAATSTVFQDKGVFEFTLGIKIPHKNTPKDALKEESPIAEDKSNSRDSALRAELTSEMAKRDSALKAELSKTLPEQIKKEVSEQTKKETAEIINTKMGEVDKRIDAYNDRMIRMERNFFKKNIRFELGSKAITFESRQILAELIRAMNDNPNLKVELVGHSCDIGEQEGNRRLSFERAEATKKYLVENGINASRITTRGEGVNNPYAPNNSEMNRRLNRRVEFIVTE